MAQDRISEVMQYANTQFVSEDASLVAVRAVGETLRAGLQMSVYEGALLQWLLRLHGAKDVLEIGTFVGLSALTIAQILPPDGTLTTLERDTKVANIAAQHFAQHDSKQQITLHEADALQWLAAYSGKPWDAVFIDGEKKSYAAYLTAVLPNLSRGALIIADNTLLFGAMLGHIPSARVSNAAIEAMQEFHTMLADKKQFDALLLPTLEGLTVAIKK